MCIQSSKKINQKYFKMLSFKILSYFIIELSFRRDLSFGVLLSVFFSCGHFPWPKDISSYAFPVI